MEVFEGGRKSRSYAEKAAPEYLAAAMVAGLAVAVDSVAVNASHVRRDSCLRSSPGADQERRFLVRSLALER